MRWSTAGEVAWAIREMVVRGAPAMGQAAAIGLSLTADKMVRVDARSCAAPRSAGCGTALIDARPTAANVRWAVDRLPRRPRTPSATSTPTGRPIADAIRHEAERDRPRGGRGPRRLGDPRPGRAADADGAAAPAPHPLQHRAAGLRAVRDRAGRRPSAVDAGPRGARLRRRDPAVPPGRAADGLGARPRPASGTRSSPTRPPAGCSRGTRWTWSSSAPTGSPRNGDTANKIGTYPLAVLARRHGVPFYVCAPLASVDPRHGRSEAVIAIEERRDRGGHVRARRADRAARPRAAMNPAFDVTPNDLITAIVTEEGVFRPPFDTAARRRVRGGLRRPAPRRPVPGAAAAPRGRPRRVREPGRGRARRSPPSRAADRGRSSRRPIADRGRAADVPRARPPVRGLRHLRPRGPGVGADAAGAPRGAATSSSPSSSNTAGCRRSRCS